MGNFNDNVTHLGNVLNANVDSGYLIDRLNMLQYKNKLSSIIYEKNYFIKKLNEENYINNLFSN